MKRDMDLIREILLKIEEAPTPKLPNLPVMKGWSDVQVNEHLRLLVDDGWVTAVVFRGGDKQSFANLGLTSAGHDFLDLARSPTIWKQAKERFGSGWTTVGLPALVAVLTELAKKAVGL